MILIITRSLSLIGPFSKSTFARATLIDHSVDMLQAYIGIKYLRAELWRCLSCQGGWGGEKGAMPGQKEAVVFIRRAWKCISVSLWQHSNLIFSPLGIKAQHQIYGGFLMFPLESRKVKILSSSWRAQMPVYSYSHSIK